MQAACDLVQVDLADGYPLYMEKNMPRDLFLEASVYFKQIISVYSSQKSWGKHPEENGQEAGSRILF